MDDENRRSYILHDADDERDPARIPPVPSEALTERAPGRAPVSYFGALFRAQSSRGMLIALLDVSEEMLVQTESGSVVIRVHTVIYVYPDNPQTGIKEQVEVMQVITNQDGEQRSTYRYGRATDFFWHFFYKYSTLGIAPAGEKPPPHWVVLMSEALEENVDARTVMDLRNRLLRRIPELPPSPRQSPRPSPARYYECCVVQ